MNKDEFMNEVGKQVESVIPKLSKECIDYIIINAGNAARDGFLRVYDTSNRIGDLIELMVNNFNSILRGE